MSIKSRFLRYFDRMMFCLAPGALVLNPNYFIRRNLLSALRRNAGYVTGCTLDLGCGSKPYEELFDTNVYIGVDVLVSGHKAKRSRFDVLYDGKTLPMGDETFDSVFASECFEHVFNLEEVLQEVRRVLRSGGVVVCTLPFVWCEHEVPYDFGRYTSFGFRALLERNGFTVVAIEKSNGYFETNYQLFVHYIYMYLFPANPYAKLLLSPFVVFPLNLLGSILTSILPRRESLFNNLICVARKPDSLPVSA